MKEALGNPHYYTAEEVRARLECAKQDGEMFRDHRGVYHQIGSSGTSGCPGVSGFSGYYGRAIPTPHLNEKELEQFKEDMKQRYVVKPRFSLRRFVREGIKDLKSFFKKGD